MAKLLRIASQVLGAFMVIAGVFWALQGLGIIMWPAESFMLADRQWTVNGSITAVVGAIMFWFGRRIKD